MIRVAPELAAIVRLGVLTLEDALNVARDAASRRPAGRRGGGGKTIAAARTVRRCARCIGASASIPRRRARRPRRCCGVCARATAFHASTVSSTSATGARSSSSFRTGSTISRPSRPQSICGSGADGEEYEGIGKDVVHVAGRMTLADQRGPFGNPTSDSARSMVTPSTVRALCTVFAPIAAVGCPHRRHPDRDRAALPRRHRRAGRLAGRHIIPSSVPSESRHARRGDRRCRRPGCAARPAGSETVRGARWTHDPRSQR